MMLTLSFGCGLSTAEHLSVATALDKLVAESVIESYERQCDDYWVETDAPSAWGPARERDVEQEDAKAIASAVRAVIRSARFTITVMVEHDCSGCGHCCETEETIWTTERPASPESMAITRDMLAGVLP